MFAKQPMRAAHLAYMEHPAVTAHLTEAWKEEALCNILPHHGRHFANNLFLDISVKRKTLGERKKASHRVRRSSYLLKNSLP